MRRALIAALLAEIGLAALLPALPGAPGAVRLAGVSLTWWYAGLGAPLLAALWALGIRR